MAEDCGSLLMLLLGLQCIFQKHKVLFACDVSGSLQVQIQTGTLVFIMLHLNWKHILCVLSVVKSKMKLVQHVACIRTKNNVCWVLVGKY
jgi:hypothetical protein